MNYEQLASEEAINRTVDALKKRGIEALVVGNKAEALAKLRELIPAGAPVMTGGSVTLDEIGLTDLLKSKENPWSNWKSRIFAEKDQAKQMALRKESSGSDYYLASAHAISEDGIVVQGSATGSQIPAFSFLSPHALLVTGAQKIVPTEADAIRRVREYCLPKEDQRQKSLGAPGSTLSKMLVTYGEMFQGRLTVIIVKEKVGV